MNIPVYILRLIKDTPGLNWNHISKIYELTYNNILEFYDYLNLDIICEYKQLSSKFIRFLYESNYHRPKIKWENMLKFQALTYPHIQWFLSNTPYSPLLMRYQKIPLDIISEIISLMVDCGNIQFLGRILKYQDLCEEYIKYLLNGNNTLSEIINDRYINYILKYRSLPTLYRTYMDQIGQQRHIINMCIKHQPMHMLDIKQYIEIGSIDKDNIELVLRYQKLSDHMLSHIISMYDIFNDNYHHQPLYSFRSRLKYLIYRYQQMPYYLLYSIVKRWEYDKKTEPHMDIVIKNQQFADDGLSITILNNHSLEEYKTVISFIKCQKLSTYMIYYIYNRYKTESIGHIIYDVEDNVSEDVESDDFEDDIKYEIILALFINHPIPDDILIEFIKADCWSINYLFIVKIPRKSENFSNYLTQNILKHNVDWYTFFRHQYVSEKLLEKLIRGKNVDQVNKNWPIIATYQQISNHFIHCLINTPAMFDRVDKKEFLSVPRFYSYYKELQSNII